MTNESKLRELVAMLNDKKVTDGGARIIARDAINYMLTSEPQPEVSPDPRDPSLFDAIKRMAAEVDSWPQWMKGGEGARETRPSEPRFVAGMVIGRNEKRHRHCEITLTEHTETLDDGIEVWNAKENGLAWCLDASDLSRVLFDPRTIVGVDLATPGSRDYSARVEGHKEGNTLVIDKVEVEKPVSPWKPEQRLTLIEGSGHVHRLLTKHANGWAYESFDKQTGKWLTIEDVCSFDSGVYVPWPRVGDWVRCTASGHNVPPFRVISLEHNGVYGAFDGAKCYLDMLEPASPPEPPEELNEHDGKPIPYVEKPETMKVIRTVRPAFSIEGDGQPKRFSGPHWKNDLGVWRQHKHPHEINAELRDLDLARRIEAIEQRLQKESK